jgi:hypothetical protein
MGSDANKAIGSDKAMRDAEKEVAALAVGARAGSAAMTTLQEATEKFVEKLGKSDISKMNVNNVLGNDTILSRALAQRFALSAPELVPSALPKMNSKSLRNFNTMYEEVLAKEIADAAGNSALLARLTKTQSNYRKSFGKNVTGVDDDTAGATPAAAAGTGATTP